MKSIVLGIILLSQLYAQRALADKVLVVAENRPAFAEVLESLGELREKNTLVDFTVTDSTTYEDFLGSIREVKPKLLLVLDNKPTAWAIKFTKEATADEKNIKAVAAMGINLKAVLKNQPSMAGVAYEVPGFTIVTAFRSIVKSPIRRVLTFYRSSQFQGIFDETRQQLARESIELVGVDVDAEARDTEALTQALSTKLQTSFGGQKVDAIYILTDNVLLNEKTLNGAWLQKAHTLKIPFLCGVEVLATKKANFCTFAASPDHQSLGHQVGQMVFSILEDNQRDLGVDNIVSVVKTFNLDQAMNLQLPLVPRNLKGVKLAD